jgi:hypothetical protein
LERAQNCFHYYKSFEIFSAVFGGNGFEPGLLSLLKMSLYTLLFIFGKNRENIHPSEVVLSFFVATTAILTVLVFGLRLLRLHLGLHLHSTHRG